MKRLDAAKLERLGRLVCGPLWQGEFRCAAAMSVAMGRVVEATAPVGQSGIAADFLCIAVRFALL
jgi:hypothetical protein